METVRNFLIPSIAAISLPMISMSFPRGWEFTASENMVGRSFDD
jgi:hypothetical protein